MRIDEQIRENLSAETQASLSEYAKILPNQTINRVESDIREISPLFLKECPYEPNDTPITKFIKVVFAALKCLSYARSETRTLVRFQPLAKEVENKLNFAKEKLSSDIYASYLRMEESVFIKRCLEEKLKLLQGKQEQMPKQELIGQALESYQAVLGARSYVSIKGTQYPTADKTVREKLIEGRRQCYEGLYNKIDSSESCSEELIEQCLNKASQEEQQRFVEKLHLNEKASSFDEFLTTPLKFYT